MDIFISYSSDCVTQESTSFQLRFLYNEHVVYFNARKMRSPDIREASLYKYIFFILLDTHNMYRNEVNLLLENVK